MPVNRAFQPTSCRKYFFKMRLKKIIYPHFRAWIPVFGLAGWRKKWSANRKTSSENSFCYIYIDFCFGYIDPCICVHWRLYHDTLAFVYVCIAPCIMIRWPLYMCTLTFVSWYVGLCICIHWCLYHDALVFVYVNIDACIMIHGSARLTCGKATE